MKNRILSIFASFLILLSMTVVPAVAAPSGLQIFENDFFTTSGDEYVQGEFIVKFKPDIGKNKIAEINSKNGASIKRAGPHFMKLNIPQGRTVSQIVESYSRNPNVEYAEPNYIANTHMVPDDGFYGYQWHLDIPTSDEIFEWHGENGGGINIEPAWDIATGTGVIVAVIDTGVAYEDYVEEIRNPAGKIRQVITYAQAPDLVNTNFVQGYDFVNNDEHPNDDAGHGTHVAGTIAQSTNNGIGVAGVAFNCSIMPIKVLDASGSGGYDDIADGVYYAANNSAQVISMSLGGTYDSNVLKDAVAYAHNMGVTIVCSAGNDATIGSPISYPAAYDDCIAVGATRYDETVSYYSTTGNYVDIAAPGGDIRIDQNGDGANDGVYQQTHNGADYTTFGYYLYQGTSMAAPHVSGVAALLISNGVTGPDNIREAMESTAEKKGFTGHDPAYGWGIVDAYAALKWTATPNNPPVAYNQSVTTYEDTFVAIILNATESDGDTLAYSIVSAPSHGALTGTTPDVNYTPDADYNGSDSFTFLANDGNADSNIATVTITVEPVNDQPVADSQSVTTEEGTPVNIVLTGSDVDGDTLIFIEVTDPSNGALVTYSDFNTSGNLTYTPDTGFIGDDSFTFKVSDGTLASELATVSITVTEINSQPVAVAGGSYTGTEGVAITFNGSGSYDPNSDPLTYAWDFGDGSTGTGVAPVHTYTADGTYNVTLIVNDGTVDSALSTTTANVSDTGPVASFTTDSPKPVGVVMTFSDTSTSHDGITVWNWNFGDGNTSGDQNPIHVYKSAGTYPVTLTVKEADGGSDACTSNVTVTEPLAQVMHIASIDMSTTRIRLNGWYTYATAKVMIVDATGSPVEGATVSCQWSGLTTDTDSETTGADGTVPLNSDRVKNAAGTFTFTVKNVELDERTYNSSANVVDSGSIDA